MNTTQTATTIFILLATICAHVSATEFPPEILMVYHLTRHGTREPLKPKVYLNYTITAPGELLPPGMRQHFELGRLMRKRYSSLLSENYNSTEIYIQSSNLNRTLQSVEAQLLGLFPLGSGPSLKKDYPRDRAVPPIKVNHSVIEHLAHNATPARFLPLPIHTNEIPVDYLLYAYEACASWKELIAHRKTDETAEKIASLNREFKQEFIQALKTVGAYNESNDDEPDKASALTMEELIGNMWSLYYQDRPMPFDMNSSFWKTLNFIHDYVVLYEHYDDRRSRQIGATRMLQTMLAGFERKIKGNESRKFVMWSGHDITILALLSVFDVYTPECLRARFFGKRAPNYGHTTRLGISASNGICLEFPQYAADLSLELWKRGDDNFYVRMLYNGEIVDFCRTERSDGLCPWDEFAKRAQAGILPNLIDECQNTKGARYLSALIWVFVLILVVLNFGLIGLFCFCRTHYKLRKLEIADKSKLVVSDALTA